MSTIQAKRIKSVLDKVKRVGRVEDTVTVSGCELTLQNLSPKEFEDALKEIEGLEDVAYAHAFQLSQISRSIVALDGCDLRESDTVEDEVPDKHVVSAILPTKEAAAEAVEVLKKNGIAASMGSDGTKTVKLERHKWLQDNVLRDWGRETLMVVWRKFAELLVKAEDRAKNGVAFLVPDETAEDRYRRLLHELKEGEGELPMELVTKLLGDVGLIQKSTIEELEAANKRLAAVAAPQEEVKQITPAAQISAVAVPESIQQKMAARKSLNTSPVALNKPNEQPQVPAVVVPAEVREAAAQNTQGMSSRSTQIATLEASFGTGAMPNGIAKPAAVADLLGGNSGPDLSQVPIDAPPPVGINPRFRPRY